MGSLYVLVLVGATRSVRYRKEGWVVIEVKMEMEMEMEMEVEVEVEVVYAYHSRIGLECV